MSLWLFFTPTTKRREILFPNSYIQLMDIITDRKSNPLRKHNRTLARDYNPAFKMGLNRP